MAAIGCDQLKSKKSFVSCAITDDELLIGLSTMKSSGVVGKDFPKPNIDSFRSSKDSMNAIKLRIACLEKTIPGSLSNKADTADSNDTTKSKLQPADKAKQSSDIIVTHDR